MGIQFESMPKGAAEERAEKRQALPRGLKEWSRLIQEMPKEIDRLKEQGKSEKEIDKAWDDLTEEIDKFEEEKLVPLIRPLADVVLTSDDTLLRLAKEIKGNAGETPLKEYLESDEAKSEFAVFLGELITENAKSEFLPDKEKVTQAEYRDKEREVSHSIASLIESHLSDETINKFLRLLMEKKQRDKK